MIEKVEDIEVLVGLCVKHRITKMKFADLEFELDLPPTNEAIQASKELAAIMERQSQVTDEDILMNPMAGLSYQGVDNGNN